MNEEKKIHIGKLIKEKLSERKITCAEFARQLCLDRSSVYNIFSKETLDVERLKTIGEILDFDFLSNYYQPKSRKHAMNASITLDDSTIRALQKGETIHLTLRLSKK